MNLTPFKFGVFFVSTWMMTSEVIRSLINRLHGSVLEPLLFIAYTINLIQLIEQRKVRRRQYGGQGLLEGIKYLCTGLF